MIFESIRSGKGNQNYGWILVTLSIRGKGDISLGKAVLDEKLRWGHRSREVPVKFSPAEHLDIKYPKRSDVVTLGELGYAAEAEAF